LLEDFDSLYDGILSACKEYQTVVLGGDIVASRVLFVSVTMIGSCEKTPILRSGAQIGDVIAVSGSLGDALGGLQLLEQGSAINTEASRRLIEKQRRPKVNVDFAQLSKILGIHAMMDLSDGLLIDLAKLAHSSGVATQIQASLIPISDELQEEFPLKAEEMALNGGEDYELLLVGAGNTLQDFVNRHPKAAIIGKVIEGERGSVTVFDASGFEMELSDLNWEHFK
jgi:thiamine-monophosphate kinase